MKQESINSLKEKIISTYKKYGNDKMLSTVGKSYSGVELAKEVEDETEFGVKLIDNMIQLTIDLVKRDKVNYDKEV